MVGGDVANRATRCSGAASLAIDLVRFQMGNVMGIPDRLRDERECVDVSGKGHCTCGKGVATDGESVPPHLGAHAGFEKMIAEARGDRISELAERKRRSQRYSA